MDLFLGSKIHPGTDHRYGLFKNSLSLGDRLVLVIFILAGVKLKDLEVLTTPNEWGKVRCGFTIDRFLSLRFLIYPFAQLSIDLTVETA